MIIEMSGKHMKTRNYLKQVAQRAAKRLERFGVPIHRIQIRLIGDHQRGEGRYKECQLSLRGNENYHLNVKEKGRSFQEAMKSSFKHIESMLGREHDRKGLKDKRRVSELVFEEDPAPLPVS